MKAVTHHRYGGPAVVGIDEMPKPTPDNDEILVRVYASSVTRSECELRRGASIATRVFGGMTRPRRPVLGTAFAGVVEATGEAVTRFDVGDPVFAIAAGSSGAHAEFVRVKETGPVEPKPDQLTFEGAAAICDGALTALDYIFDEARVRPGQAVLVNGAASAVGSSAVQIASFLGGDVTGVCGPESAELVRSLGATRIVDHAEHDLASERERYDVVFDAVGEHTFARYRDLLKRGGSYLTTGLSVDLVLDTLWTRLVGTRRARILFPALRSSQERPKDLALVRELITKGALRPVVERAYAPEAALSAHRYVDLDHQRGSVILRWMPEATTTSAASSASPRRA